jgi:hypothetical protein
MIPRVNNTIEIGIMKITWMLLVAIVTASSVSYNFATVISDASTSVKKDHHLVVMASEVKVLNIALWHFYISF